MRNGTFTPLANLFDPIRPASEKIAKLCALFAAGMFDRLDKIADNTGSHTVTRRWVDNITFAAAGAVEREVPVGQSYKLALLAASAAGTVTIRSGGRLMYVKTFANADTVGPDATITAGPGSSFTIAASAGMEVTLHIDIVQRDDAQPGYSGSMHPDGIRTNAMELAINQHFPGVLDVDGDPYHLRLLRDPSSYGTGDTRNPSEDS